MVTDLQVFEVPGNVWRSVFPVGDGIGGNGPCPTSTLVRPPAAADRVRLDDLQVSAGHAALEHLELPSGLGLQ